MRLGLHVQSNRGHEAAVAYCEAVKPAGMKWLDPDPEVIARCYRVSPRTRHGLRQYWNNQTLRDYPSFQNAALDRTRHVLGGLRARGIPTSDALGPIVWMEGYNEHIARGTDHSYVRDFAGKEVGLARALNDLGAGALIGGFSTGFLDEGLLEPFRAALELCHQRPQSVALHAHEYAAPYMGYMMRTADGRNQWGPGGFTGVSASRDAYLTAPDGWLVLRYRMLLRALDAAGLGKVRLAITEAGNDDTPPRPGGQGSGWKDWAGTEWARTPMGDYADQWHVVMTQIARDAERILFVVDYGFATIDPHWRAFDLSDEPGMLGRIVRGQQALPERAGAPAPTPAPAPIPAPAPAPPPVVDPAPDGGRYVAHTLRSGDTLWRLGGGRWRELLRAIDMGAVTELPVGATVLIPEDIARARGIGG